MNLQLDTLKIQMMKKLISIILFLLSQTAYAEYDNYWLELSAGVQYGETLKFKVSDGNRGWALIYSKYNEDKFWGSSTNFDRETLERLDTEFKVYGLSKFFSFPNRWLYVDLGAGLGFGSGSWVENCSDYEKGWFGASQKCDLKESRAFGVPFHASATFGKYLGIGVNIDVFLSFEKEATAQMGIVIPFGLFNK